MTNLIGRLLWWVAVSVAAVCFLAVIHGVPDNPVHPSWPNVVRPSR